MKRSPVACSITAVTLLAALAGCQSPFPNTAGTYGNRVRATLASQVVAPPARADQGTGATDGAAAAAAYANYQHSYATPVPQTDSPTFGTK